MVGPSAETESAAKRGTNGQASTPPDELAGFLERNADRLGGLFRDLRILGNVDADRARLRLRRVISRIQSLVVLSIGAIVLVAAGVVILAVGVDGAFRALFTDRPWLGDLVAGSVLIAAPAAAWLGVRAAARSAEARRLEKKYADLERDHAPRP